MIQLSEMLSPRTNDLQWKLIRQAGVSTVVATLDGGEQDARMFASVGRGAQQPTRSDDAPWSEAGLRRNKEAFEDYGFSLVALEDTPPLDQARLAAEGRDEQIDNVITQVRAMGRLGIRVLCYNWMALSSWGRTNVGIPDRGGALVTGFNAQEAEKLPQLAAEGVVTDDVLWSSLEYFLDAVIPEAEEAGVRLAMHPDDPPRAFGRGISHIMRSPDAYRRLMALRPSPSNAITFCQGNFALMDEPDLPALIREFGASDQIAFVHFRDVRGTADNFRETFHDDGQTDMPACMDAYASIRFDGPIRPDHVPTLAGETNDHPGYETLGRLFALGYARALIQSSYRTPA